MALTKLTVKDDFYRYYNLHAKKPKAAYTPALGDLVVLDASITDGVDRGAADENPYGILTSINSSNGTVSVAEFSGGVTIVLEYTSTAPTLLQKIECNGDRGTIIPTRDRVRVDNPNGVGAVLGVDSGSPGGTGTCVVRFP